MTKKATQCHWHRPYLGHISFPIRGL